MSKDSISAEMVGIGCYVPEKVLTNADFERIVDTSDEWITTRTGIKRRHVVGDSGEATSDMCIKAARQALADADMSPKELDLILIGTCTPDMKTPSAAVIVQRHLGATNAAAFDINAACVGYIYGLKAALAFIKSGMYRNILVMGSETLTSITNYQDRTTCVLFGDGAGAAVIKAGNDPTRGILASRIAADGRHEELLFVKTGGSRNPVTPENIGNGSQGIYMNGSEIFRHAVRYMQESSIQVLEDAGMKPEDLKLVIPHQANIRIIDSLRKRLHLPKEKVFVNIQEYGNTSSASIPIAMVEARSRGLLEKGDLVLMVSFGGGLVWGACLVRL